MKKTASAAPPRAAAPPPSAEAGPVVGLPLAAAIHFVLSFVYFLPALLPGRHIFGTDYFGGGFFFYRFISERLAAGELPKWVPYIFGGLPLSANPGSTYQPVHFLADLLLPATKIFAAVFVVHFALAGIGTFLLARGLGARGWVALAAGLAYQFTGVTLSWVYGGQDGRIIVATVAPLFLYFLYRGVRGASLPAFAGAAATLSLALLSFQIQNSYYLLLGGLIWAVFLLFHLGLFRRRGRLAKVLAYGLLAVAFGFVLATVDFLPFLDYLDDSPRGREGGRGYAYSVSFSMPAEEVVTLAVPEQYGASVADPETGEALFPPYTGRNGFKLHTEYVGALVLVLLALGFRYARGDRYWWFFLGLGAFMLSIALGGSTPLYRLYYELLPGTKQFRAPSLAFFMVVLSLVAMGALTLERIAALRDAAGGRGAGAKGAGEALRPVGWIAGGVAGVAVLGMLFAGEGAAQGWGRFAVFAALVAGALWLWTSRRIGTVAVAAALALVTVADLWVIGKRFFHVVDPPEVTFAADDVVRFLRAQPEPFRFWAFPYPRIWRGGGAYGSDYPMLFDLEQVGGEHPNMLARYVEYVGAGTETYIDWHNLVAEAGVVETPEGQAIAFRGEEGFLDAANVRYLVSTAPLSDPDLRLVHAGTALVYENVAALPRAYLVPAVASVPAGETVEAMRAAEWDPRRVAFVPEEAGVELPAGPLEGEARVVLHEPDRVVVEATASRDALLVLADNYFEGWRAEVDGRPAEVVPANHAFRGVVVPAGEHRVEFVFRPDDLYTGLYVTLAGFALLVLYGAYLLVRRRRAEPEAGDA